MLRKALVTLAAAATTVSAATTPVVKIAAGEVHGGFCTKSDTRLFQGIPFAEPPVDSLRFMPPQAYNKSFPGGVFDATKPPAACIQWPSAFDVEGTTSEDCLYLDVYVPADATADSALPVKVFGYGGSDLSGAITYPLYDACNLAAAGAIVVTFNYRLGPLGFLGLASAGIQGNMAIQDYVVALQWVKSNIAHFGGDTSKVLLFGQSSGGDDTSTVSTLPEAKELVTAVIMESGGGEDMVPYDTAQYSGALYAETLGCSTTDLACLQCKSVDELVTAYETTPALQNPKLSGGEITMDFGFNLPNATTLSAPFIDGKVIKENPLKVGSQVPMIAGMNQLDGTLLILPVFLESSGTITEANYTSFLDQWGVAGPAIGKQYPLSLFNTTGSTSDAVLAAISYIMTVASFECTTYRALRAALAAGTPAYAYRFNHTPSCPWIWEDGTAFPGPELADIFGSTHTAELPFVFGNLDDQPWGNGTCNATASERELSETLIDAWTAMASTGNPSTSRQKWPQFDTCQSKGVWVQEETSVSTLDFSECEFWDEIWAELGGFKFSWPSKSDCSNSTGSGSSGGSHNGSATATGTTAHASPTSTVPVTASAALTLPGQFWGLFVLGTVALFQFF